jgi:hypothetical protein
MQRAVCARFTAQNQLRQKTNFTSPFNPITPVQPSREKYSSFVFSESIVSCSRPVLTRGAFRDRHER